MRYITYGAKILLPGFLSLYPNAGSERNANDMFLEDYEKLFKKWTRKIRANLRLEWVTETKLQRSSDNKTPFDYELINNGEPGSVVFIAAYFMEYGDETVIDFKQALVLQRGSFYLPLGNIKHEFEKLLPVEYKAQLHDLWKKLIPVAQKDGIVLSDRPEFGFGDWNY